MNVIKYIFITLFGFISRSHRKDYFRDPEKFKCFLN